VFTAVKGRDVLGMAKKYRPSLITLDIMLDDVDGFDVLEELKADPDTRDIPVVIASVLKDVGKQGMALGAADYLVKPFDKEQVLTTIQKLVETLDEVGGRSKLNKILIADDDKDIVNWLKMALSDSGFQVRGAYNGREAILLAREDHPDLILLDLKMPIMDGVEVIQELKEESTTADIPIIVITGSSIERENETIKMLGLGAKHLLTKPFSLDELVSEIKRLEQPVSQTNAKS
jgi:DNA-binding response OmpR family regulator